MIWILVMLCVLFIIFMVDWSVHISMNKGTNNPYDWCTFKTFVKEFDKYKNHPELKVAYGDSIFLRKNIIDDIVYLHASIICFEGKCMILYPFSYLRYCIWKYNFIQNKNKKRVKDLWK